jgi:hypothetical protein
MVQPQLSHLQASEPANSPHKHKMPPTGSAKPSSKKKSDVPNRAMMAASSARSGAPSSSGHSFSVRVAGQSEAEMALQKEERAKREAKAKAALERKQKAEREQKKREEHERKAAAAYERAKQAERDRKAAEALRCEESKAKRANPKTTECADCEAGQRADCKACQRGAGNRRNRVPSSTFDVQVPGLFGRKKELECRRDGVSGKVKCERK